MWDEFENSYVRTHRHQDKFSCLFSLAFFFHMTHKHCSVNCHTSVTLHPHYSIVLPRAHVITFFEIFELQQQLKTTRTTCEKSNNN